MGGMLFALTNFVCLSKFSHSLPYYNVFFPSLINDTYIVGHVSNAVFAFLCLQAKFSTLGFSIQSMKCVTWSPHELNLSISLSLGFLTCNTFFHILNAPMGSVPFV
jgi:hypothetical protein